MIRSMTGFGRGQDILDGMSISVEIKSVNHRYFDFSCRVPRSYGFLEEKLKTYIQTLVARGKIECYVGIGQIVDAVRNEEISFEFTLNEAKKRNDKRAIKVLEKIGPPVNGFYKDDKMLLQRNYLNKMGGILYGKHGNSVINTLPKIPCMFKEYSFFTMLKYVIANEWCLSQPLGHEKVDFLNEVKELAVPVYLFMGKYDYNTVSELAREWLENLEAPHKEFFEFEKSGHTPQWEEAEKFNELFVKQVLKVK